MINVFSLFINGVLVTSVLYILALLLDKIIKTDSTFKSLSITLIVVVTTYALIISSFNSYLLILSVFVIYGLIRSLYFKEFQLPYLKYSKLKITKEWLLILFYFIISFFLLNIQTIVQSNSYIDLQPDFSLYAGVSEILSNTGIESIKIDLALEGKKSFTFYHYFELWFNSLLSKVFSVTHLKSLVFITLPVLSTIMLRGLFELQLQSFSKNSIFKTKLKYLFPLSIFFLFPFTMTLRWILSLGSSFQPWNFSIALIMSLKWIIVLSALIFLFLDYNKNKLKNTVIIAGFMAVVYPVTMIATVPGLIMWFFLFRKKIPKIAFIDLIIIVLSILMVLFYVNSYNQSLNLKTNFEMPSMIGILKTYFFEDKSNLLLFIKIPILKTIYMVVAFSPLLILMWFRRQRVIEFISTHITIFSLFMILYIVSTFGVVLLDFSINGDQIHRNIFYPLYILIFYIGLFYFLIDKNRKISISAKLVLSFAVALNIYGLISTISSTPEIKAENYSAIVESLKNSNAESAFIVDSTYFRNENNKNFYFEIPAQNIRFSVNNYFPHLLSLDRINIESMTAKFYIGQIFDTSKYYEAIIAHGMTYKEVIKNDDNLNILIIHKNAPEIKNAEEIFNVYYLGEIEEWTFYKKNV